MKTNHTWIKKSLCILLCLVLLAGYLPFRTLAEPSVSDNRVADPSTMDRWKSFFHVDPLNTTNAGSVWTDKSVFTDEAAFAGTGITLDQTDHFLVALSAMGSNMSVTGISNIPTDTMLILDLSSSMYDGYDRNPATVNTMLASVNQSIDKIQSLNRNNRVGVVVYYGGPDRNPSTAANSMILLPLDRYTGTSTYLTANLTGGKLISVAVNAGLRNSAGEIVAQATHTVADVAGTYAQLGILDAMSQFLQADPTVQDNSNSLSVSTRTPVFIFMSDGEPTAATYDYTKKVDAAMGNNTVTIRSPQETDFVTQLTAAYAKEMVDVHYDKTTPLFYTLSLGTSVSLSLMDPANYTTSTIDSYWDYLLSNGHTDITVYNSPNGWGAPTVKETYTVSTTKVNGSTFPSRKEQKDYVDMAFTAETAGGLTEAFSQIVNQINLVSKYTPTLVSGNADLSGYISFVDKVGQYMDVTDIKGVLINNHLYSGADLAQNFVTGGGELGTYDHPTFLGDEMVHAVRTRIGLPSADAARTLIALAYECGQLSYTSPDEYSNYIGWYANAAGEFLGFWHENVELPETTGNAATDPVFIIKSYGYLGEVDKDQGVRASDMMYATVQVRKHIATGEEMVVFAIPANLIPLLSYEVTLDSNGDMSKLERTGAEHPIRLVYEVGLDKAIHKGNVTTIVSQDYLDANTNSDGSINFYTNQYEVDSSTGYGKVNTYSYFNPSRENDRYYYLGNTTVYADTKGTVYTGTTAPQGVFYRQRTVYTPSGAQTLYRQISPDCLATAKAAVDGTWYIPAGSVHVNLNGFTVVKTQNPTETFGESYIPFVDTHDHSVGDLGYRFIVGATLGNNGRITVMPETGIALSKTMIDESMSPATPFTFVIKNLTNPKENNTYIGRVEAANQPGKEVSVSFTQGSATVSLTAGQTLYITGMTPGISYTIEEMQTVNYLPLKSSFSVTTKHGQMVPVTFVNAPRGIGSLMISKEILHDLGTEHTIPKDKSFRIQVALSGIGVANTTFRAVHSEDLITSVTTDANGCFQIDLCHDQQVHIMGIPEGTVAQVTEPDPGTGFTPCYHENGVEDDGIVTIPGDMANVAVLNRYEPAPVDPVKIDLKGTKTFLTSDGDWNGEEFEFQLQKWANDGWETIATATAKESKPVFDFSQAMAREQFTQTGHYHYQVKETYGGETIHGVSYDPILHTFTVSVTDADMDGQLEISQVTSTHTGRPFQLDDQGNWSINISFKNQYNAAGCDLVLDVLKILENPSGSPLVSSAGYQFGLFSGNQLVGESELSDGSGEARLIMHYDLEDEGIHTYILKELIPAETIPGMHYDDTQYTVTVQVKDLGDGTTYAEILSIDGKTNYDTPVFTNRYQPQETTLDIDFVTKVLLGRDLIPGEFTFELRSTDHDQVITGTNDEKGKVIFSQALQYNAVGIYHYELRETSGNSNGITADEHVYSLRVKVVDQDGQLTASYSIPNLVGVDICFTNTYTPQPVSYTISGRKVLTGRVLLNEEFTFCLAQTIKARGTIQELPIQDTKNLADGSFRFQPIIFTLPGHYTFLITESNTSSADYGIVYDETQYLLTVIITDNLKGQLEVSNVQITTQQGVPAQELCFTNRYIPDGVSFGISGYKKLAGKTLTEGQFQFELYEADSTWNGGKLLETTSNTLEGTFSFSAINYDTAGARYYLVREKDGGNTRNGIVYDDEEFRVLVDVVDDLRGQLLTNVTIFNQQGIVQENILFHNLYTNTLGTHLTLEGVKELVGQELKDGAFTFQLFETGEDFVPTNAPIHTATNYQGTFSMTLDYPHGDPGTVYHYTLMEENAGKTIDGIRYSSAKYDIQVRLLTDGQGGICPQVTITQEGKQVSNLVFVNEYQAPPVDVVITGTKELMGNELEADAFTFGLYEADTGTLLQTAVNDAQGRFAFPALSLSQAGTYHYVVKEDKGGQVVDQILYDDTQYHVTIQVENNGKLEYTLEMHTQENAPATQIHFRNRYVEQPPKTEDPSLILWMTLLILTSGAALTIRAYQQKKKN